MNGKLNELTAISPIDGRYRNQTQDLSKYLSEYAYIKYRLQMEIKYLLELSSISIIRKLKPKEVKILNLLISEFDLSECLKIKKIEATTKHDLKAIEYYIKNKTSKTSLIDVAEYIHFGLTSEDINNIAFRLMLKESRDNTILPTITNLNEELKSQANKYKRIPMLARTHGQPAVPTTLGKELLVFSYRLDKEIKKLKTFKLTGKLNGAVGNYNALYYAYPKINWTEFSKNFISSFELKPSLITTQINNPEDIIEYFQIIYRINGIVLDLDQDIWRYISDGWFIQKVVKGEIGSSTMPQKVNPILFENSEGNIIIANSLINAIENKLSISRLQRDLSGSTVTRNLGVILAYSIISWVNSHRGIKYLEVNKIAIELELNKDWSILSEAVQIILKKEGINGAYENMVSRVKGKKITKEKWKILIEELNINDEIKSYLLKLTPENYIHVIF